MVGNNKNGLFCRSSAVESEKYFPCREQNVRFVCRVIGEQNWFAKKPLNSQWYLCFGAGKESIEFLLIHGRVSQESIGTQKYSKHVLECEGVLWVSFALVRSEAVKIHSLLNNSAGRPQRCEIIRQQSLPPLCCWEWLHFQTDFSCADESVKVWKLENLQEQRKMFSHTDSIFHLFGTYCFCVR